MTSRRKDRKMHRSTADRLLREVTDRIAEANGNEDYAYRITEAYVFGSYVNSDKDMLSDLDIAIRLEQKWPTQSAEYYSKQCECPYSDTFLWLIWPREEVLRYIRNRSGYISIHILGNPEEDEIIFSDKVMQIGVGEYRGGSQ